MTLGVRRWISISLDFGVLVEKRWGLYGGLSGLALRGVPSVSIRLLDNLYPSIAFPGGFSPVRHSGGFDITG